MSIEDGVTGSDHSSPVATRLQPVSDTALDRVVGALAEDHSPRTIGRYRLIELIGEGGMGEVWRAEQERPIRRIVAVKLIKLGMDTREIVARFQAERQALAMLNHPNVAKVLDAGATDAGRPYFVMEYVPGEPLTAFCDRHRCTIRQRLQLFLQACAAMGHAHQKGILHRDLKPGNILATDGEPQVKVIDFGVAKALESRLGEHTLQTLAGQLIGTPEYMSPEQALSDGRDVDTRSDIYSLGVVLYELLSGALPQDPKRLRGEGLEGIFRMIREFDPPRPVMRLRSLTDAELTAIAQRRQMPLRELTKDVKGELEWIVMRAMRKERSARYATVGQLAQDVQNFLENRPLLAARASRSYRAKKFIQRNKAPLVLATLMALLLAGVVGVSLALGAAFALLLTAGSTLYLRGIRKEQAKALAALEDAQRAEAQTRQALSWSTALFAASLRGRSDLTVGEILDEGGSNPFDSSHDELLQASVRELRGLAFYAIKRHHDAIVELTAAERFRANGPARDPIAWLRVRDYLCKCYFALKRFEDALEVARESYSTGMRMEPEHPLTVQSGADMAGCLEELGRISEAIGVQRDVLAARLRIYGPDHRRTSFAAENLARMLLANGDGAAAEPLIRQALAWNESRTPEDVERSAVLTNAVGRSLVLQGKVGEGEPLLCQSSETLHRVAPQRLESFARLNATAYRLVHLTEDATAWERRAADSTTAT
jgi:eukaryotic-like serine/threonine-protein kinase